MKIQNIHTTTTPADFIILGLDRHLIEVKEIDLSKNKIFAFNRLTQKKDLIEFNNCNNKNFAWVLLNFKGPSIKSSFSYLIPIDVYSHFENKISKKSINVDDAKSIFKEFQMNVLDGGIWDLYIW